MHDNRNSTQLPKEEYHNENVLEFYLRDFRFRIILLSDFGPVGWVERRTKAPLSSVPLAIS